MVERVLCLAAIAVSAPLLGAMAALHLHEADRTRGAAPATARQLHASLEDKVLQLTRHRNEMKERVDEVTRLGAEVVRLKAAVSETSPKHGPAGAEAAGALAEGQARVLAAAAIETRLRAEAARDGLFAAAPDEWMASLFAPPETSALEALRSDLGLGPAEETWRRLRFRLWGLKQRLSALDDFAAQNPGRLDRDGPAYTRARDEILRAADESIRLMLTEGPRFQKYIEWAGAQGAVFRRN